MNTETPPDLPPDVAFQPPEPPRGLSSGAKWGIGCGSGCLVALLVAGILGYLAWVKTKEFTGKVLDEFTDKDPVTFVAPEVDQATIDGVITKFDEFRTAMTEGRDAAPLMLSGDEINLLIHHHPDWKGFAGHTSVEIVEDQLKGQLSIPLDEMGPLMKGRYLNGTATIRLELEDGVVTGFIDQVEVAGHAAPPEMIRQLQTENIFDNAQNDPETRDMMRSLESIKIEEGQIIIVPKPASERKKAQPNSSTPDPAPAVPPVEV